MYTNAHRASNGARASRMPAARCHPVTGIGSPSLARASRCPAKASMAIAKACSIVSPQVAHPGTSGKITEILPSEGMKPA